MRLAKVVWSCGRDNGGEIRPQGWRRSFDGVEKKEWKRIRLKRDKSEQKRIKPDKNGKRVEAEKSLKQLQWVEVEKPKKTQKEWSKMHTRTEDVQPPVVPSESLTLTSEPVNSTIIEPVAYPVSAPKPNQRPSIPYPSRFQDQNDLPVPDLRTMKELCQPSLNGRGGPIAPIAIQETNFGLKNDMIQQVQNSCQFHGILGDDANKHLDKFLHVTHNIKVNGVIDNTLRLYLFPHSLTYHATAWFDRLPRNSINTFEQMA
nr:reverse transcriptase domain-containing protein [Tanacetum cinerariifolium]